MHATIIFDTHSHQLRPTMRSEISARSLCTRSKELSSFLAQQGRHLPRLIICIRSFVSSCLSHPEKSNVSPSDSIIFLYLGIAMVNYQMYQWDPVFISVTFFLCLFVRSDNIQNADSIEEFDIAEPSVPGCSRRLSTTIEKE